MILKRGEKLLSGIRNNVLNKFGYLEKNKVSVEFKRFIRFFFVRRGDRGLLGLG